MQAFITRLIIMGTRGVVTSGHYLATAAGFRIMEQGGNAIDAAAAMCFCLNLLEPQSNGIGGEVSTLIYSAKDKDGEPFMVFGTPGGDGQDQWTLQFFLNYVDFGMNIQEALDAPTVHSVHFPTSFYPRDAYPGRMMAEGLIPPEVIAELERRGHEVVVTDGWVNGKVMGIRYDKAHGIILGGVAPKGNIGYALGW